METKKLLIIIGSLIFIFAALIGVYYLFLGGGTPSQAQTYEQLNTIAETDQTKWSDNKAVVLSEHSDLQCPACAGMHSFLNQISTAEDNESKRIRENVTLVYRHFPLQNIHPRAMDAAKAAEAAGKQKRFFEMIELLYTNQSEWSGSDNHRDVFVSYAEKLKLNKEQFVKDMDNQQLAEKITSDIELSRNVNVNATPTFFLNGKKMDFRSFDEFKESLLEAIDSKE